MNVRVGVLLEMTNLQIGFDGRENVQGLGANQIGACIMDGPKLIRNMSEISEVSELGPKFEYCFYRNIANF